ncbi:type II toxin-antitoxin system RelE/ParE family toxin [Massilia sp. YIM B04103]|uniref:type II toxin-antitoxin system RelE family toxin n=1 Tax=Massilia sp. YIM B04103 TaxID=2963106 RepID=UPI002109DE61|nr:type II toxin-antitoxin system RelE/ParE family toxin [Massilia sp. YIM B04103]
MKRLNVTNDSLNFLAPLPAKQYRQLVDTIFRLLKTPEPHDSSQLKGYALRRVDCGEYRIIYRVQDEDLFVLLIGKRNDAEIYKKLGRTL